MAGIVDNFRLGLAAARDLVGGDSTRAADEYARQVCRDRGFPWDSPQCQVIRDQARGAQVEHDIVGDAARKTVDDIAQAGREAVTTGARTTRHLVTGVLVVGGLAALAVVLVKGDAILGAVRRASS